MRMRYLNVATMVVAEYDPVMGMYYVEGEHYTDGPMVPHGREEIEDSTEWVKIEEE